MVNVSSSILSTIATCVLYGHAQVLTAVDLCTHIFMNCFNVYRSSWVLSIALARLTLTPHHALHKCTWINSTVCTITDSIGHSLYAMHFQVNIPNNTHVWTLHYFKTNNNTPSYIQFNCTVNSKKNFAYFSVIFYFIHNKYLHSHIIYLLKF